MSLFDRAVVACRFVVVSGPIALSWFLLVGACADEQRRKAACEQLVAATCATRDHCGGIDAKTCEDDGGERSCNESPEDARRCILALNTVLTQTCTQLPADLPCPADLLSSALYDACSSSAECRDADNGITCVDGLCSQTCDDVETYCPREGACNTSAGRCEDSCNDLLQPCASDLVCVEDRCLTCDEACVDKNCDTGTTCSCGVCEPTPCEATFDCPSEFGCLAGACSPCLRDDQGSCLTCVIDDECGEGICDDGGLCV